MSETINPTSIETIKQEIIDGLTIPFLGLGIFKGYNFEDGSPIPSTNDELIIKVNDGRAMAPRMMIDFSRAFMQIEQRKGRRHLEGMLNLIYTKGMQTPEILGKLHALNPKYMIDTNYDSILPDMMEEEDYNLILGVARITEKYDRYEIYHFDAASKTYNRVEAINYDLPILFKTMGSTKPQPTFIASDADFVDWLTEAMGGYGMPNDLKEYRKEKKYLFLGFLFDRDTERMVGNEMTMGLGGGYVVFEGEPTRRCAQFMEKHNLEQINLSTEAFVKALA